METLLNYTYYIIVFILNNQPYQDYVLIIILEKFMNIYENEYIVGYGIECGFRLRRLKRFLNCLGLFRGRRYNMLR